MGLEVLVSTLSAISIKITEASKDLLLNLTVKHS